MRSRRGQSHGWVTDSGPGGHIANWKPRTKLPAPKIQHGKASYPCLTCQRYVKPPFKHCFPCYSKMSHLQKAIARSLWDRS